MQYREGSSPVNAVGGKRCALRRLGVAVALALGTAAAVPGVWAQQLTGELVDSARSTVFEGAIVRLQELDISTRTDERGRFRLTNIPPGSYTLVISYVGAPEARMPVTVTANGLELGEIALGAGETAEWLQLEEVLVHGQSAAMAGAINQQRAADTVKSILDSDTMGQFPDQNVAESLRRLSGVTVENDQGEGRYVVIRGMDPDLNATSINGVRASSAEDRRALQLDVIPTDVLDGLEVQKSLTPDMDGDAIGGSVNVKTLSAFSRKEVFLKTRFEGGYNELREDWSPKASVAFSNIFELPGERRLGIAAALSFQDRKLAADNFEADDWEQADNGADYPETFEPRYYLVDRQRIGAVLNLDYDLSATTTVFMRSLYSEFEDTEARYNQTYGDLTPLADESVVSGVADFGFAEIAMGTKDRVQTAENLSISVGSDSVWERWSLSSNFGFSYGEEREKSSVESTWVAEFETGADGIADGSPVMTLDSSNSSRLLVASDHFDLLRDPSRYELDEIVFEQILIDDTQWSLQLDATRHFDRVALQFGGKARLREKVSNPDAEVYGGDDVFTVADVLNPNAAADYGFPNRLEPFPALGGVRDILRSGEGIAFDPIDSLLGSVSDDWTVEEDIYAGYGLIRYDSGRAVVVAGVRLEYTDFSSRGNLVELYEEGAELNGTVLDDDLVTVTALNSTNSYTDVLPSVNVRYEMTDSVVARAAVSRSVVRPLFEAVASRVAVEDNEASVGNPDLEPYSAWNYDLSLEYYPSEISVLSAGLFYKSIEDFIFTQVFEDFEFGGRTFDEVEVAQNGDDAEVWGLELNYQQQFGFLPTPFDGFLVSFNYTYVDSDASFAERDIPLPKQSDNIAGFVLGYEKYGLDLRLAMSYRDRYLDEIVEEGLDRYTDAHNQWDFTAKYRFGDNWMMYAEVINLNDEPAYYYAGSKTRPLQYDEFGRTTVVGVQYLY
ncbi:TonB-dependent receptor [Haliea sp.]|jgi:TonB-dependent receptor|uniref:TonB-dependent receptor n=1 Tax=Haliea sp. TaxID=1932666 RepID=UPI000C628BD4|nr:TonB-dependent receptor [Haliea sp.]MAD64339.1 TonB-dependent receptor [Haliea sp.]MAY93646.1 TonB-dependent receptor [Haliea sp.]MBK41405.1 TonB-dependent receptor [Haliea sp.]MBP70198.1 TonB-dependent receptor [Haliea sp.]|tara:strand:- start:318 stop:3179 length:2862 start_codon:yes stop_codon:yes gene_type:complete